MPRLFVALDVPESVKIRMEALFEAEEGVKWVRPGQVHLTLRFIGEVDAETTATLTERLHAVSAAPFPLRVGGVGVFPGRRRPRVLWVGADGGGGLATLHARVESAVREAGLTPDEKPFHPHLTLARLRRPDPAWVRAFLSEHRDFDAETFTVSRFHLYESRLLPEGATHLRLAEYPLSES
jgi:2'-5' RNA ligase